MGEVQPEAGKIDWGITTTRAYLPNDNSSFFQDASLDLINWLRQYSKDQTETFLRGFLGRMLFSGEEALKKCNVLSGGEKVRCMLSKMMLSGSNVLVMENPTNHLDLSRIGILQRWLKGLARDVAVIVASHDRAFLDAVTTRSLRVSVGCAARLTMSTRALRTAARAVLTVNECRSI